MKMQSVSTVLLIILLCVSLFVNVGCSINNCCGSFKAKYERAEEHTISMAGLRAIDIDSQFGSITVTAEDRTDCWIDAKITAQAPTDEEARQIAEESKLIIESKGDILRVYLDTPKLGNKRCIGATFEVKVPHETSLDAFTSFGAVKVKDVRSNIKVVSSFGTIKCQNTTGDIDIHTSFGAVELINVTTESITANTSFGNVKIVCVNQNDSLLKANVSTSYGNINFTTPPDFAGRVKATTSFGNINSDLPITVRGNITKDSLSGTIGKGDGNLNLNTSFGSIKIK